MSAQGTLAQQTTELLQELIRNAAVNDGTPDSGHEHLQVRTLQRFFEGSGLEGVVVEPHPGRASLIVRIEGTDPTAPSLALVGHTDVVPVEPSGWSRDPFAGEIVDGVLWGTDPERFYDGLPHLGNLDGFAHASTHTTISPTIVRAGEKGNVIPGTASVQLDIRILPDVTREDVEGLIRKALGDLIEHIEIEGDWFGESTLSPVDTPLFDALGSAVRRAYPSAELLPMLGVGGTDGRFYRRRGIPAYGFGVLSGRWDYGTFRRLFHGNDERIDLDSIALTVDALDHAVRTFHADTSTAITPRTRVEASA